MVINAVMMGLGPRQARARFDHIIEFAELEEFVDLKLKNYSSGMQVRLAFSVMVESDADVMLIDEVLAVGDAAFQQKCLDVFYRLREEGKTILLVTHDMGTVERFCHRAMMLRDGRIELHGRPAGGRRGDTCRSTSPSTIGLDFEQHRRAGSERARGVVQRRRRAAASTPSRHGAAVRRQRPDRGARGRSSARWSSSGSATARAIARSWRDLRRRRRRCPSALRGRGDARGARSCSRSRGWRRERWYVGCAIKRGAAGVDIVTLVERAADVLIYGAPSRRRRRWERRTACAATTRAPDSDAGGAADERRRHRPRPAGRAPSPAAGAGCRACPG